MSTLLRLLLSTALLSATLPLRAGEPFRSAPNPDAPLVSQLLISGNACGPAALLNAFRLGSPDWQLPASTLPGDTERERLRYLIRRYGVCPSSELKGRNRWSRAGVNLTDLLDMANEMARPQLLPQLRDEVLILAPGGDPHKLLARAHHCLEKSLRDGLPPIISVRQMTFRKAQEGGAPGWITLRGHFVTVTRIPSELAKNADSFPVGYIDPWGAKRAEGIIRLPTTKHPSFCLEVDLPTVTQALKEPSGEKSAALTFAAVLGRF